MKKFLAGLVFLAATSAFAADPIPGEVDCKKGGEIEKVKALVKRSVEALKKDQAGVMKEISAGDAKWKDGTFYMFVYEEGKVLAHGFNASMVGRDLASVTDADKVPYIVGLRRTAMEKGEGCIGYKFPNPAKGGQVEDKVGYVMKVSDKVWAGSGTYLVSK